MKNISLIAAGAILATLLPLTALAATFQAGKSVAIPKDQIEAENLYLAGGQVIISTTAQKDLVAAGGSITVNGPVYGDALIAGGTVNILNEVRGDVRAAGGQITISGMIAGDVLIAGGQVSILPGSVVGGDVVVMGGTVDIEGTVNGKVQASGGEVTVNGTIAGPIAIKAKTVVFGDRAVAGGTIAYTSPKEATIEAGAKIGSPVYTNTKDAGADEGGNVLTALLVVLGVLTLIKFAGALTGAVIVAHAFPRYSRTLTDDFLQSFWQRALLGFITLILTPIACILLAITVLGIYIAFFLGLLYMLLIVLSSAYLCIFVGAFLARQFKKEPSIAWQWTLLGAIAVFLVWLVPFLGWAVEVLLLSASMGVMVESAKRDLAAKR